MPLVYNFSFPPPAAGETVTITDDGGAEHGSEVLGSVEGNDGAITLQVALNEGEYIGTVTGDFGTWTTRGYLDVPDSIEDAPGASETAYFTGTGPVYETDGGGSAGTINFVADDRQGDLPAWVSLSAGDIVLGDDAGTCAYSLAGSFDFDFAEASAVPDTDGTINNGFVVVIDGDNTSIPTVTDAGDNEDEQTLTVARAGSVFVGGALSVEAYPGADDNGTPINDGAATPRVALTITRLAPAPELP